MLAGAFGSDVRLNFPKIAGATGYIDLDFPEKFLPTVTSYPVAQETTNNRYYMFTEEHPNGRALRVQFFSEVPGLFGVEGRGWSKYSIVLEADGNIYAQKAIDGAQKVYDPVKYQIDDSFWSGQAERVARVIAEAVADWEIGQRFKDKSLLASNIDYRRALWLDRNRNDAWKSIPENLFNDREVDTKAPVDLDKNSDYPADLGVNLSRSIPGNDSVSAQSQLWNQKSAVVFRFSSEVDVADFGRDICLTREGIKITGKGSLEEFLPVTPKDRLSAILAGALVAIGTKPEDLPISNQITKAATSVHSIGGQLLPKEGRFEPGSDMDKWDNYGTLGL